MQQPRQKVLCYITRNHAGKMQVLVFEHLDFPEAGVQVPAGSIDPEETAPNAALRETWEESGVESLVVQRYIGAFRWSHKGEEHERHVFLLATGKPLPERWKHTVSAGAEDKGLRLTYYWMDVDTAARVMIGNQGDYLHYLADL